MTTGRCGRMWGVVLRTNEMVREVMKELGNPQWLRDAVGELRAEARNAASSAAVDASTVALGGGAASRTNASRTGAALHQERFGMSQQQQPPPDGANNAPLEAYFEIIE
eukprot:GHVU01133954.1.p3 GENE.GHVU01133954.1~~GHVU01133954.1.p3  ORF type:complete len:109 (+),score=17.80 GHVU01133954.1:57-383(+)